jgi:hypothetical protein
VAADGGEVFLKASSQFSVLSMKIVATIAVLAAIATIWLLTKSGAQVPTAAKTEPAKAKSDTKEVYLGLRNSMLQGSRAKFGLPPGSVPTEPWGVVMDQGLKKGTFTTVATCDGSASLYFSNGGGYIGGKGQEPIKKAAEVAVRTARDLQAKMTSASSFPLPAKGEVTFYVMTDSGVFTAKAAESDLKTRLAPLAPLWGAMQNVITEYRLWDQGGRKGGGGALVR